MENTWLSEAVSNNAAWCAAIAASHNIASSWRESIWFSEHTMSPLYPNIVTLSRGVAINEQIIDIDQNLRTGWGIKDSYKDLELEGNGFTIIFDAFWYCRIPSARQTGDRSPNTQVKYVKNQSELHRWAQAWGEKPDIFKPSLLLDEAVEFIFLEKNGLLVAGLATNLSGNSIGISNAFGLPHDIEECVKSIIDKHPSKGIVGYGDKAEVAMLSKIGFQEIGELRIWLRS